MRGKGINLFSIGGKLVNPRRIPGKEEQRSKGYTPVTKGGAVSVKYLYFHISVVGGFFGRFFQLLITTFCKTEEEKNPAREVITVWDPKCRPEKKGKWWKGPIEWLIRFGNFGADNVAHELIYYTKSYDGSSIKISTRMREVNHRVRKMLPQVNEVMQHALSFFGKIPILSGVLPFIAAGSDALMKALAELISDTNILLGHDYDLFFNQAHRNRLQEGRHVCIPGETSEQYMIDTYRLDDRNRLVDAEGVEYRGVYFVIQVDGKEQPEYEMFDYFQSAGEILSLTQDGVNFLPVLKETAVYIHDARLLRRIFELGNTNPELTKALAGKLSPATLESMNAINEKAVS